MGRSNDIEGLWTRIDEVIYESGMSRAEIARKMGFERKALYECTGRGWGTLKLARFCAVTGTDANWLLGLTKERKSI